MAFHVGRDDFSRLEIRPAGNGSGFHYFYDPEHRELVKEFVLQVREQVTVYCEVTLIGRPEGTFEPRLTFVVRNSTTRAIQSTHEPVLDGETRLVKARVDLSGCHEETWQLIRFIESFDGVAVQGGPLAVVSAADRQLLAAIEASSKDDVVAALQAGLVEGLDERDIALLTGRRAALSKFERLLTDAEFFESERLAISDSVGPERVWQDFFEANQWIFGYGLRIVCCDAVSDERLETIVVGSDVFDPAGKRTDALMMTRGRVSGLLFCEIKTPEARLTVEREYRSGVYEPAKDLRGGIAQLQKTIHKVSLKATANYHRLTASSGSPTGQEVSTVQPRGVVIVGLLSEFEEEHGVNYERFASFELLRHSLHGLEVVTFDELLERARFIVRQSLGETQ